MSTGAARGGLPLRVRSLQVAYADAGPPRSVLDVTEWNVAAGAHAALCGPSGSGKTTLLHALAGIERPTRGTVNWGAVEVTALTQPVADRWRRETIGIVFQQFHLFPGLSALQNVVLPFRFDRWQVPPAIMARASALLDRVGVRARADVAALSRGEAQRAALARALIREPAIVLADEPTASLDARTARDVADLLVELCGASGATLVVATHDAALATRVGRIFDLVDGDVRDRRGAGAPPRLVGAG